MNLLAVDMVCLLYELPEFPMCQDKQMLHCNPDLDIFYDLFLYRPDDVERVSMTLLDYQQQELEKYRLAVHTMGQDILTLRQQVGDLQTTNSQLRRDLARHSDTTRLLLDAQELDGLSKPELAERYGKYQPKFCVMN